MRGVGVYQFKYQMVAVPVACAVATARSDAVARSLAMGDAATGSDATVTTVESDDAHVSGTPVMDAWPGADSVTATDAISAAIRRMSIARGRSDA